MKELMDIYERYLEKAAEVRRNAKPMAGLWGMGDDPRNHPCHQAFYEAVQEWLAAFSDADPDAAMEALRYIYRAPPEHKNDDAYWYLFAVHGLTLKLIDRLRPADCRALFAWYDTSYPKRDRLPVQQDVWKALKKHAK